MLNLTQIRLKLTFVNTAVLISLSAFVTVMLYIAINIDLEGSLNNTLKVYCSQLSTNIDLIERRDDTDSPDPDKIKNYEELVAALKDDGINYIIWDENFNPMERSDKLSCTDDQLKGWIKNYFVESVDSNNPYAIHDFEVNNRKYKICTYISVSTQGALKVVQGIKDVSSEKSLFQNSIRIIFFVVLMGGIASLILGYVLSGRSLVPIKKSMEQQQEFLADASHELRTPIAVIQTNLELVKNSPKETIESQIRWINNAYNENRRMNRIVADLMFLARIDAGEITSHKERIDICYHLMDITERMLLLATEQDMRIIVKLPDDPIYIFGDEKQFAQLMVILLDNAIKYGREKTSIIVSAALTADGIEIIVADKGIGISTGDQEKIFHRFYRVNKDRSRSTGGTGLGLSIAQWIVNDNRGKIRVESEEGYGTKMILLFPEADCKAENE